MRLRAARVDVAERWGRDEGHRETERCETSDNDAFHRNQIRTAAPEADRRRTKIGPERLSARRGSGADEWELKRVLTTRRL